MRLSVPAVLLILLFSQTIQAQHSSAGGGGSGGGGGGGSHGGGSSGGGSSSGGHSGGYSSGGSGSHGSGSSGSAHGGNPSHGAPTAHIVGKIGVVHENAGFSTTETRASYYSTVPGDSPAVHDHLLDQALARIRVEMPADLKTGQPVRVEIQKHKEPGRVNGFSADKKGKNRAEAAVRIRLPKPCRGKKCAPPPPTCAKENWIAGCGGTEYVWRFSEEVYTSIQDKCGYLARRLAQEESRAAALRGQQQIACSPTPLSPECASATRAVAQSDSRIARLREQYERCVFSDLRHTAVLSMSRP